MHEILGRSSGNVAEVRFGESIDAADLAALGDELGALIERHGKRRLLWDLSAVREGDASVIFEPGVLEVGDAGRVERVALVVGADVPGLPAQPAGPLPPFDAAQVEVFAAEARDAAMDWLVA
jgi:hypothetical protein